MKKENEKIKDNEKYDLVDFITDTYLMQIFVFCLIVLAVVLVNYFS